jgi:putative transcriptional regulator
MKPVICRRPVSPVRDSTAKVIGKLEVSRQTVNAIETGRYDSSLPLAFKLADVFKVSIEDIFMPDKD